MRKTLAGGDFAVTSGTCRDPYLRVRIPLGLKLEAARSAASFFLSSARNKLATNTCEHMFDMPLGVFKYDWAEVQHYYDEGNGYAQCRERFGFAKDTWIKAIRRGSIVVRPRKWPLDKVLRESRSATR
jgi:hypothetical protein